VYLEETLCLFWGGAFLFAEPESMRWGEGGDDGEWNEGHLIRRLTRVTSDCGSDEAHSFAAVGFHLCNNEHPAAALTVASL
jgi:hypothetical protein